MVYVYYNEDNYIYGYGSEHEERSFLVDNVPDEVRKYLECYTFEIINEKIYYYPDENRKTWLDQHRDYDRELGQLAQWFEWYDEQCIQYQRATRLGLEFDKDIAELDAQAVVNAARIKELRVLLATPYSAE